MNPKSIEVQIFGQIYRLRVGEDPERIRRVAALVDEKMNKIADRGASPDSYRIAVLAALELADEVVRTMETPVAAAKPVASMPNDRIASLLEKIDKEIDEDEVRPAAD